MSITKGVKQKLFLFIILFPSISFASVLVSISSKNSIFQKKFLWLEHNNIHVNYQYSIITYKFDLTLYQIAFQRWAGFNRNTFLVNVYPFWSIIFGTFISNNQVITHWYNIYQIFVGIKYARKYFTIQWILSSNLSSQLLLHVSIPTKIEISFYLKYQDGSCIEQSCIKIPQEEYNYLKKITLQKQTHYSYLSLGISQKWSPLFSTSIYLQVTSLFLTSELSFQKKKGNSFSINFGCKISKRLYCSTNITVSIKFKTANKNDYQHSVQKYQKKEQTSKYKSNKITYTKKNIFSFVQLTKAKVPPPKALQVIQKNNLCILSKKEQQQLIKIYPSYHWRCK